METILNPKVIDFSVLFRNIIENDEVIVYSEIGKKTLLVKKKEDDKITLETEDKNIIIWQKEQFINNSYNIYDIIVNEISNYFSLTSKFR